MYSDKARQARRCKAIRKDGHRCQAYARWGADDGLCARHHQLQHPDEGPAGTVRPVCRCDAYAWPHRPGGGLCDWPDPPTVRSDTLAGTHTGACVAHRRVYNRWIIGDPFTADQVIAADLPWLASSPWVDPDPARCVPKVPLLRQVEDIQRRFAVEELDAIRRKLCPKSTENQPETNAK